MLLHPAGFGDTYEESFDPQGPLTAAIYPRTSLPSNLRGSLGSLTQLDKPTNLNSHGIHSHPSFGHRELTALPLPGTCTGLAPFLGTFSTESWEKTFGTIKSTCSPILPRPDCVPECHIHRADKPLQGGLQTSLDSCARAGQPFSLGTIPKIHPEPPPGPA